MGRGATSFLTDYLNEGGEDYACDFTTCPFEFSDLPTTLQAIQNILVWKSSLHLLVYFVEKCQYQPNFFARKLCNKITDQKTYSIYNISWCKGNFGALNSILGHKGQCAEARKYASQQKIKFGSITARAVQPYNPFLKNKLWLLLIEWAWKQRKLQIMCTAKRKLERLQFSTWSACNCEFKAYFWTFWALYHLLFDLETIGVN